MPAKPMTAEERLQATIALQPVDRIVCAPWITSYAAQFAGVTNKDFMWNWKTAMASYAKLASAYPQWDSVVGLHHLFGDANLMSAVGFNEYKFPGRELADNAMYQTLEKEVISRGDMRMLKAKGLNPFYLNMLKKLHNRGALPLVFNLIKSSRFAKKEVKAIQARGQCVMYATPAATGNELFSLTRGMEAHIKDMFQMGDELVELLWKFNEDNIKVTMREIESHGVRRAFVPCTRTSATFLSKKNFDRFAWPFLKDMAMRLINHNVTPFFHMDSDWGRNLEYLLQLPKGKFVVELDGDTDIFRAKEILGGHAAIAGDVPASLLALGTPGDVDSYCRRLITEVGKGGGFILRAACTMPMDAKHENVKAFFESVDKYGRYN